MTLKKRAPFVANDYSGKHGVPSRPSRISQPHTRSPAHLGEEDEYDDLDAEAPKTAMSQKNAASSALESRLKSNIVQQKMSIAM